MKSKTCTMWMALLATLVAQVQAQQGRLIPNPLRNIPKWVRSEFAARFNLLPTAVYDVFPSVLFGRLLVIVSRFGVFDKLAHQPLSAQEIATALRLPLNSARLILPPLEAAGYLRKRGDRYSLTRQSQKWLMKSSPHFIGNFLAYIELLHTPASAAETGDQSRSE